MHITPYAISGFLAVLTAFPFSLWVFFKSPNRKVAHAWLSFSMSAVIYSACVAWVGVTYGDSSVLAWRCLFGLAVVWMPALFHSFVCIFCDVDQKKLLLTQYLLGLFFSLLSPTKYFIESYRPIFNDLCFVQPGILFAPFFWWWLFSIMYSHIVLWQIHRKGSPKQKNQIKYFFLATAIGFTGGTLNFLPHFGFRVYPWGNFSVFLYPIIMTYAITKYSLMDIRIFFRRTALLIVIYAILLLGLGPILASIHRNLTNNSFDSIPLAWIQISSIAAVLSLGPFFYAYFIRQSSFFQEHRAAGLTHELKSPLASIQAALSVLKERPSHIPADPTLNEYLDVIERNSTRLESFVNDLLQVFKVQNRSKPLASEKTNLVEISNRVVNFYQPLAKFKGTTLNFDSREEEVTVSCDPQKIETVISNLLSNALKFTLNGLIQLQIESNHQEIKVSVFDTGSGISFQDLPHIFEPFYQGKDGKTAKGAGIGLSIAKAWVEAHSGKIWAESEGEGKGTKVSFTLPMS